MKVLIYESYKFNHAILYNKLIEYYGSENVKFCDASQITNGCLETNVDLLVMPGGADLFYCEKLNGVNCKKIIEYVQEGGAYLGICAGAYFACKSIEWAKGLNEEIVQQRELNFYDGSAIGPLYEYLEDKNITKSWQNSVKIKTSSGKTMFVHYEAGPIFKDGNGTIIARYEDLPGQPAAIIETRHGKGKIILCSPHIENCAHSLKKKLYMHDNLSYEWEEIVANKLEEDEQSRHELWLLILEKLTTK